MQEFMKKFWLVSRYDDGMQTNEACEPVMAKSKSEIEQKLLAYADIARESHQEYYTAQQQYQRLRFPGSRKTEIDAAESRFLEAANNRAQYADINGFQVTEVVDSTGSICEDFEILTEDEFFSYKAKKSPRLDADGNPVRCVEVKADPLVGLFSMHGNDMDNLGTITVPYRSLIVIEGAEKNVSNYALEDAALEAFNDVVPIAAPENFSVTAKVSYSPNPDYLYGKVINIKYDDPAPAPGI